MKANFEPGAQVKDYTLLRRLAAGGMGEIWLAERKGIEGFSRRVVIKTILECFAEEPSLVDMFLDEGRIAAGLTHPNVAQTYDLGQIGRTYYIAMEYISGRDLRNLLLMNVERGQLLPLNLVLRVIAESCEGLYYAHKWKTPGGQHAGIIHRDISPQNILVTFDGKVKIIDFGIAKAAQSASKTRSGVLKGKYAYMSPEQVRGKKVDHRSDLFSLGVVMYELVTARRLFKRESELSTLDAVLQTEIPSPTRLDGSVPKEVEAVILRALARDPDRRFQDARQMQLAIEEVMLAIKMPASSAHLAAYMEELFEDHLQQEREVEQESLSRRMEDLPGVGERAPKLERTMPFAPGLNLNSSTDSHRRELTRNLLPSESILPAQGQSHSWKWALVGVLALLVALGSWFLVSNIMGAPLDAVDAGLSPAEDGGLAVAIKPKLDAGAETTDSNESQAGLGLDLSEDPPGDVDKPVATLAPGRLSVVTEPAADIFLGKKKLGNGSVKNSRLRAGRYTLKVVASTGAVKTIPIRIFPGKNVSKRVVFGRGKLRIVVMPWANVTVNSRKVGQTPIPPLDLLEGTHRVVLENPQLGKKNTERVNIQPGKETTLRMDWR